MSKPKKVLSVLLTLVILICLAVLGYMLWRDYRDDRQQASIIASLSPESPEFSQAESQSEPASGETSVSAEQPIGSVDAPLTATDEPDSDVATESAEDVPAPIENPYKDSYLANKDMHAWLQIPGTNVDYPVMWTPEDENKYLYLDFNGKDNKNGSLLLDTDSCLSPLSTNLIIHGHNMKSGAMFGNLTDYEDENYYQNHKNIILYTEECQRNYEIVAVFRSQVYKKSDQVFKFYKFFQADTREEFDDFYNNIKNLSLYDTGVTASFGDHFLTLSTCVYHVTNGRFVVVAKEVEPGDSYNPVRNTEQ